MHLKSHSTRGQLLIWLLILLVILAIIGILIAIMLPAVNRARSKALVTAEAKKLGDIYKITQMYANASFDEKGGDGLYPEAKHSPNEAYQAMVIGGFLKDPMQVKFPRNNRYVAPIRAGKSPSFDLTGHSKYVDFSWTNTALSNEDEDPTIPLAGSRWLNNGSEKPRSGHIGARNFLISTGLVVFFKTSSARHKSLKAKLLFTYKKSAKKKKGAKKSMKKEEKRERKDKGK